jgi:hypothetical protein
VPRFSLRAAEAKCRLWRQARSLVVLPAPSQAADMAPRSRKLLLYPLSYGGSQDRVPR